MVVGLAIEDLLNTKNRTKCDWYVCIRSQDIPCYHSILLGARLTLFLQVFRPCVQ